MGILISETGKMIIIQVKEYFKIRMEINMKASFQTIKKMDMEHTYGAQEKSTLVTGKMIIIKEKEYFITRMVTDTKEIS